VSFTRRYFFFGALAAAIPPGGIGTAQSLKRLGYKSPNEKLNLAAIGGGGQAFNDINDAEAGVENVIAVADVDFVRGAQAFAKWPKAEKYRDFRSMLDKHKDIDAVTVGTPDHMHLYCALHAMQAGKHVYVEKPLTRTVWEARLLAQAAEKYKVATQMGNQGFSTDAIRVACEIIWSGEIGDVTEVHAWHGGPGWPQGMQKIPAPTQVPDTLDWDLWLGTAASRPFTSGDDEYRAYAASGVGQGRGPDQAGRGPAGAGGGAPGAGRGGPGGGQAYGFYLPFNWRGFHDFGSGLFGDWGVHIMGGAYWALNLRPEYLVSVERMAADGPSPFTYPVKNKVKYEFAARGSMPPLTLYWEDCVFDGGWVPPGMTAEEARKIPGSGPQVAVMGGGGGRRGGGGPPERAPGAPGAPAGAPPGAPGGFGGGRGGAQMGTGYNCIMCGTKGYLGTSGQTGDVGLLPGKRWAEYKLPTPTLQRSPGANAAAGFGIHAVHLKDWIRACKGGAPSCSNFSIAGPYTEWLVLGAVATHYDGKLLWDNTKMEFTNNKDATKWIKPTYRKGWEVKL
jgi:hypothetical protein